MEYFDVRYVSTRGDAPVLNFEDVLVTGLARDGGLYLPETYPQLSSEQIAAMAGKTYAEIAVEVMLPYVEDSIPEADFRQLVEEAYGAFHHQAVVPLTQVDHNDWIMELYHGPTLAFKDCALQLLGRLFDYVLKKRGERVCIVGATSGDTGSAAIEACRDRDAIDIFILHPYGRVSDVQRRQMTTVDSANVHNIALDGSFDDCQNIVKALFNDHSFRDEVNLAAVNSINWARVMAQVVYYFTTAVALGAPNKTVNFTVPSGNFGDIFAGYVAKKMGLPIGKLVCASNQNDILARFFQTGEYKMDGVKPSMSPSMDIQISSNFERLLFDICDRDGKAVQAYMKDLDLNGGFTVSANQMAACQDLFAGDRCTEDETLATIKQVFEACNGYMIDPHTAVGVSVAAKHRGNPVEPMVTLSTAHPAKFPDAVEKACGSRPALPPRMADLFDREERFTRKDNGTDVIAAFVKANIRSA